MSKPFRFRAICLAAAFLFISAASPFARAQDAAASPAKNPHDLVPSTIGPAPRIVLAQKLVLSGIPNAGNVDGLLFRGAQPRHDGYQQLKGLGVGIVVDLHNTEEDQRNERHAVESLDMRYVSMPSSVIYGPTDEQVAQFLKLVRENPQTKIFVHCNLGADRTGVMVAAYRIAQQQWTPDQAYNEMRTFHFHTFLISMGHYVKYFPRRFSENSAFAALRSTPPKN